MGLVISDIRMPGGADGLDLLGWLRREQPGVKVILISGYIPHRAHDGHCRCGAFEAGRWQAPDIRGPTSA